MCVNFLTMNLFIVACKKWVGLLYKHYYCYSTVPSVVRMRLFLLSVVLLISWIIHHVSAVATESNAVKYITVLSTQFSKDQVIYTSSQSVSATYRLDLTSTDYCPDDVFMLHPSTGTVSILQTIVYDSNPVMCSNTDNDQQYQPVLKSYYCYIIIQQPSLPSSSSLLLVIDIIPDIGQTQWMFSQSLFTAKSIGVSADTLIYTDDDLHGISTELLQSSVLLDYSIYDSQIPSSFAIQQDTVRCMSVAKLYSNSTLDIPFYNLTLQLSSSSSSYTYNTTVSIEVAYANFHPPMITNNISTLTLPSNIPEMSIIATLKSVDEDISSPANTLRYRIANGGDMFGINPANGDLMLFSGFDDNDDPQYNVTVFVYDLGAPLLSIENTIMIFIETYDVFSPSINITDTSSVGELTPIQTSVATIVVQELDSLNVSVSFLCGSCSNCFQLTQQNTSNFTISKTIQYDVILIESLNYELVSMYDCNVIVTDTSSLTTVEQQMIIRIINENDPPYFLQSTYSATIPESTPIDTSILVITAHDEDKVDNLLFSIDTDNAKNFFEISSHTGLIYTVNKLSTDVVVMNISISDGLHTSYTLATITITPIDKSPPTFQPTMFATSVNENIPSTEPIFSFSATDDDNGCPGAIQYSVIQAEPPLFNIDQVSGLLYVDSDKTLDYEQYTTALITVQATSLGKYRDKYATTVLNLTILNINDNSPNINPIDCPCFMEEETDSVQSCQELSVSDKDGDIVTYQLQSGTNELFDIDPSSGVVSAKTRLDHEIQNTYELYIIASDNQYISNPVKLVIHVLDINDSPPSYGNSITITIPQDTPVGSTIGNIGATQNDAGYNAITEHMFSSNTPVNVKNMFFLDPLSGELILSETVSSGSTYMFTVLAMDLLNSSQQASVSVEVVVDGITNTAPYFALTSDRILIASNLPLDSIVTTLMAIDDENDNIVYNLNNTIFTINSNTDIITLSDSLSMDTVYTLNVSASDGSLVTYLSLTCTAYQPNTVISGVEYTYNTGVGVCSYIGYVTEGTVTNGDTVVTMVTMQGGQLISYDIIDGEYMELFEIIQGNMVTTVSGESQFNRTLYEALFLTIRATYDDSLFHLCSLTVIVNDINNNGPVFSSSANYNIEIYQATPIGSSVFQFKATDSDYGVNAISAYSLLTESVPFSVDSDSGHTRVTNALTGNIYSLTVLAKDSNNMLLNDTMILVITILSTTNTPPMFTEDVMDINIPETEPLQSVLVTLTGSDADTGLHGSLVYCMLYDTDRFSVTSKGEVMVAGLLDYDELPLSNEHSLSVMVYDGSLNPRMAQTSFNIIIEDVNDEIPTFLTTNYSSSVSEGANEGTLVLTVMAQDRDTGNNGIIIYSPLENDYFNIDPTTGRITTTSNIIDRETLNENVISFTITASDQGSNGISLSSTATVNVIVTDVNDYRPRFIEPLSLIVVDIPESTLIGDIVYTVVAIDDDYGLNGEVRYIIEKNDLFYIDSVAGDIVLYQNVDYETDDHHYELQITATDLGVNPLSKSITITFNITNTNDNHPIFSHNIYHCRINENTNILLIDSITFTNETCKVNATDTNLINNTISYSIQEVDSVFAIDMTTGIIRLMEGVNIDYETIEYYIITVIAKDNGSPSLSSLSQVIVYITDLNDETPVFDSFINSLWIPEALPVGTVLFTAHATDRDAIDAILQYDLLTETSTFNINQKTGNIILEDELYYTNDHYDIQVMCSDNEGIGVINSYSLNVLDINSNPSPPQFSYTNPLLIAVSSSTAIGTTVIELNSTDVDRRVDNFIEYYIMQKTFFSINKTTGVLSVSESLTYLDDQTNIVVQVLALDNGSPSLSSIYNLTVIVTLDSPPVFTSSEYNMVVSESKSDSDYIIGHVTALINGRYHSEVVYSITDEVVLPFNINTTTGAVYVSGSLDREDKPSFSFTVEGYRMDRNDSRSLSLVIVTIDDFNDYPPQFPSPFSDITIPSSYNIGDEVFRIFVIDEDEDINSVSTFMLTPFNGIFSINESTGGVFLLATPTSGIHNITITASNLLLSDRHFDLTITITDELIKSDSIQCNNPMITILESAPIGGIIYTMNVTNDTVFYQLFNSNSFSVHPSTGEIFLTKPLDREEEDVHYLSVIVWDGISDNVTNCILSVGVTDVDDNRPTFNNSSYQFNIIENSPIGTIVGNIVTIDSDVVNPQIKYVIEASEYSELFTINSTGFITIMGIIDRELLPQEVILTASARNDSDNEMVLAITNVVISILDDNDNIPLLIQSLPTVTLMENVSIGTHVATVTGLDLDLFSRTSYSLMVNESTPFIINNLTGEITTSDPIDYEKVSFYQLSIITTDIDNISLTDTTVIPISVYNLIDTLPDLLNTINPVSIIENSKPHTFITSTSTSSTPPHSVLYTLVDDKDVFYVEPFSGVIRTLVPLDYEKQSSYNLTVLGAFDDQFYSKIDVVVNVLDANDNPPETMLTNFTFVVSEGAMVAIETVFDLSYIDHDEGANGMIRYVHILEPECDEIFLIDTTGTVTLKKPLDKETRDFYHFIAFVADNGTPSLYLQHSVTVIVADINDNYPKFDKNVYSFVVSAPIILNQALFEVTATDIDSQSAIVYRLVNGTDIFDVNAHTGEFHVHANLHLQQSYSLSLTASDEDDKNVTVLVIVEIIYCSFNYLSFQPFSYTVSVAEDTPIGTLVLASVINDFNQSGLFYYSITTVATYFTLNSSNGELYLNDKLDYESINNIDLLIQVKDTNSSELRIAEVPVQVIITDVNDNPPLFVGTPYAVFVRDNIKEGSIIFTPTAIDNDANTTLTYSLPSSLTHDSVFDIDKSNGNVTVVTLGSSYSHGDRIELVITASDNGKPLSLATNETLVVTILNSNAPSFSQAVYISTILESTISTTVVLAIKAFTSNNSNAELFYSVVDSNLGTKFPFSIHPYNGDISVNDRGLDRELTDSYIFFVEVEDTVLSLSTKVEVRIYIKDVNDEPPQFTKPLYTFQLNEDAQLNTLVGIVSATDIDTPPFAQIEFYISSLNIPFRIDSSSGEIYNTMSLDYESTPSFQLSIYANDSGAIPLQGMGAVRVIINNINDNPPLIQSPIDQLSVPEFPSLEYLVAFIFASDPDSDELSFDLVATESSGNFIITDGGLLQVRANVTVLPNPSYQLTVLVTDQLYTVNTTILINVIDANDNSPVFSEVVYHANITENSPAGIYVATVTATDDDRGTNAQIDYSGNLEQFHVDSVTGIITTTTIKVDREESEVYDLIVIARDGGDRTDMTTVSISVKDTNDNIPIFTQPSYVTQLAEESEDLSPVLTVTALDPDEDINGTVSYKIVESNITVPFLIYSDSGLIQVFGDTNYEVQSVWSFDVIATDGGGLVSTAVNVTVNLINIADANPQFSQEVYTVSVPEKTFIATPILTPNVTYPEPCLTALFSIFTSSSLPFSIESIGGDIRVVGILDRLVEDNYIFDILVDCSIYNIETNMVVHHFDTAGVQVAITDINEPPSVTLVHVLSVSESAPVNATITIISATDNDLGDNGTVRYTIVNSDDVPFQIDEETGVLMTADTLDREDKEFYDFFIKVYDLGTPSLSREPRILISIVDENDSPPYFICENVTCFFNASIPEGTQKGSPIITLPINDPDSVGNITFKLTSTVFSMNPVLDIFDKVIGGVINTVQELDREVIDWYEFEVIVNDGIHNSRAFVLINITDINDNSPIFTVGSYEVTVFENYLPNQIVVNIAAIDKDEGINAVVTYELLSSPQLNNLSINASTGSIVFLESPDYEVSSQIDLLAQVVDNGGLSDTVAIVINILDENDNTPIFSEISYSASVYENALFGTDIRYITATDIDSGDNGLVLYYLSDESLYFQVNMITGLITSKQPLNREVNESILLTVIAMDSAGVNMSLSTSVNVTIAVLDINDNAPVFAEINGENYTVTVSELANIDSVVLTVNAFDADIGSNAELSFYLTGGNSNDFVLKSVGNKVSICVAQPLNHEGVSDYNLLLSVVDNGIPSQQTDINLSVYVRDENDNLPMFVRQYEETIPEDMSPGLTVLTVVASDLDSSDNVLLYSFLETQNSFIINTTTGDIIVNEPLDYETTVEYVLTVIASEQRQDPQTAETQVVINIEDVNDNPPVFVCGGVPCPVRQLAINENQMPPQILGTFSVIDYDSVTNINAVSFSIASGDKDDQGVDIFSIDALSGDLTTLISLDREIKDKYQIVIVADDNGSPSLISHSNVTVIVNDLNDNRPIGEEQHMFVYLKNGELGSNDLGRIAFTDKDIVNNYQFDFQTTPTVNWIQLSNKGTITLDPSSVEISIHSFEIRIIDTLYNDTVTETCTTITIETRNVTESTLHNSITMSIIDITPIAFINDHLIVFMELVSSYLNEYIDGMEELLIFSVTDSGYVSNAVELQLALQLKNSNTLYLDRNLLLYYLFISRENIEKQTYLNIVTEHVDYCSREPCSQNGLCSTDARPYLLQSAINKHSTVVYLGLGMHTLVNCDCYAGKTGQTCSESWLSCDNINCGNNGQCIEQDDVIGCQCDRGFVGESCDIPLSSHDLCDANPCNNSGICTFSHSGFTCTCQTGFTGKTCTELTDSYIDGCYSNPCLHGGVCNWNDSSYTCTCPNGYTGNHCEVFLYNKECLPECEGCIYSNSRTQCVVTASNDCHQDIVCSGNTTCTETSVTAVCSDECLPNPCGNGGHCVHMFPRYYCKCPSDYTGPNCEQITASLSNQNSFILFPSLDLVTSGEISLEFITTDSENGTIFYAGRPDNDSMDHLIIYIMNGHVHCEVSFGGEDPFHFVFNEFPVNDGNWYTILVHHNTNVSCSI